MPAGASVRVLLIDDLPEMRRLVELYLEDSPARVVGQAPTCSDAVPLIERHRPDVVVMDMHMPGRNGIECTAELMAAHPELLIAGFTSTEDPTVETRMREAGAAEYFHKSQLRELVAWLGALRPSNGRPAG
jgi:DNA-binding NarL/FixJ family response regulator